MNLTLIACLMIKELWSFLSSRSTNELTFMSRLGLGEFQVTSNSSDKSFWLGLLLDIFDSRVWELSKLKRLGR